MWNWAALTEHTADTPVATGVSDGMFSAFTAVGGYVTDRRAAFACVWEVIRTAWTDGLVTDHIETGRAFWGFLGSDGTVKWCPGPGPVRKGRAIYSLI